jgi:methionyl-tRNA formyltransferase
MTKLAFFGTGPVAAKSLESLVKKFQIEFVITKKMPAHFRGAAPVEGLAKAHNLPVLFANARTELDKIIADNKPQSRLGVVVDYGVIISEKTINYFPLGIINSHFSRLPQWRGADPISFAILSGQKSTGVSLMLIAPELDTGKLIAQRSLKIANQDTTPSLTDKLINLSNKLLIEYIPKYINGQIKPRRQPHVERDASYSRKLTKADGQLDPAAMTATECERKIRAFLGYPKTRLAFHGQETIVTKAQALKNYAGDNWPDVIKCANNTYLQIQELVNPKSGKQMKTADYLRGLR